MSWAVGYDQTHRRDIGYGVPSQCDHPKCSAPIDRGLAYVCGGEPYGGEYGCGLYFCLDHLSMVNVANDDAEPEYVQLCERNPYTGSCELGIFDPTPDTYAWQHHKLTDPSWLQYRRDRANAAWLEDALTKYFACPTAQACETHPDRRIGDEAQQRQLDSEAHTTLD